MSDVKTLTYDDMLNDLNSIQLNKSDVLFEVFADNVKTSTREDDLQLDELNSKLEKYTLFKSNLNDLSSLSNLNDEFDSLDKRLNSLQHFIDVSKKFFHQ